VLPRSGAVTCASRERALSFSSRPSGSRQPLRTTEPQQSTRRSSHPSDTSFSHSQSLRGKGGRQYPPERTPDRRSCTPPPKLQARIPPLSGHQTSPKLAKRRPSRTRRKNVRLWTKSRASTPRRQGREDSGLAHWELLRPLPRLVQPKQRFPRSERSATPVHACVSVLRRASRHAWIDTPRRRRESAVEGSVSAGYRQFIAASARAVTDRPAGHSPRLLGSSRLRLARRRSSTRLPQCGESRANSFPSAARCRPQTERRFA
jgi:hypothetical protein